MSELSFFLAEKLIWVLGLIIFLGLFLGPRKSMAGAFISGSLAYLVGKFIKDFWFWPRPVGAPLGDGSFPSNHTSLAFGMAFYVFLKHRKLGLVLLGLASLVGVGRILTGVHFATDVVGGIALGCFVAWLVDNYHSR